MPYALTLIGGALCLAVALLHWKRDSRALAAWMAFTVIASNLIAPRFGAEPLILLEMGTLVVFAGSAGLEPQAWKGAVITCTLALILVYVGFAADFHGDGWANLAAWSNSIDAFRLLLTAVMAGYDVGSVLVEKLGEVVAPRGHYACVNARPNMGLPAKAEALPSVDA